MSIHIHTLSIVDFFKVTSNTSPYTVNNVLNISSVTMIFIYTIDDIYEL